MNALLASVRDVGEAALALAAGADWIDLKEPGQGALGAVDRREIARVVDSMKPRYADIPVSATIGDCWDEPAAMPYRVGALRELSIDYAKIGLYAANPPPGLLQAIEDCCRRGPPIILVCFAEAPPDRAAIAAYAARGVSGMMLDTADKHGGSLTDRLPLERIRTFVGDVHDVVPLCGLAGSLKLSDVPVLASLGADYLGFRGALCAPDGRTGPVSQQAVAAVRRALDGASRDSKRPPATIVTTSEQENYRGMA